MSGTSEYIHMRCPACGADLPSHEDTTVICQFCGTRLFRRKTETPAQNTPQNNPSKTNPSQEPTPIPAVQVSPQSTQAAPQSEQYTSGMRFSPFVCPDPQGTGMEAFKMLIPTGWQFRGGVYWIQDNPGMPAVLSFQVFNPSGAEGFEVFPNQSFYWDNNPMTQMTFPVGSRYFGNEVRPPMNAQQMLRQVVLPRFRKFPEVKILKEDHLPDLPNQMRSNNPANQQNAQVSADGARVRIRYPYNGVDFEEEIYGVVEVSRAMMPGTWTMVEMIFWFADYLFSFRAKFGQLDKMADLFKTIISSIRINPQWYAKVTQISQYMIQNQIHQIHNVGQLSRMLSQNASQISDSNLQGFYDRQATMDRISNNFSQTIRGVDQYFDPNQGQNIELPSGYNQAWSNPLGEYIVSDDPNFNPNVGSNLSWTTLNKSDE
jgi:hypothetical protein